jgi:hypothetical protein
MRMARHCNLFIVISALALLAGCGIRSGLPIGDAGVDAAPEAIDEGDEGAAGSAGSESSTEPEVLCGNGIIDDKEQCDGDNLEGETCLSLGEGEGQLNCGPACLFDVSMCAPLWPGSGGYGTVPPAPVAPLPFDAGTGDAGGTINNIIRGFPDAGTADGGAAGGGLFGGGNFPGGRAQGGGNTGAQGG